MGVLGLKFCIASIRKIIIIYGVFVEEIFCLFYKSFPLLKINRWNTVLYDFVFVEKFSKINIFTCGVVVKK